MIYYAQLNEENICIAVSQLSGEVDAENMIKLETYDASLLGMKYVNGVWEEVEQPDIPSEPTQLDRIEETVNSIASGTNETAEAMDALLGV